MIPPPPPPPHFFNSFARKLEKMKSSKMAIFWKWLMANEKTDNISFFLSSERRAIQLSKIAKIMIIA